MYKYILAKISYIENLESIDLYCMRVWAKEKLRLEKANNPIKSDQHIYIHSLIPLSVNKVQEKFKEVSTEAL